MANKSVRRLLRSGLSFFIRAHEAATMPAAPPAASKLKPLQSLIPHYTATMQGAAVRSAPTRAAGHFLCLPLQYPRQCLSTSSASHASSVDEAEYTASSNEEDDEKPHAVSNSCSKLRYKPRTPSFKSLLHHPISHDQLYDCHCATKMASYLGSERRYTRSWSAPSLLQYKRHPRVKLPQKAGSFSSGQSKDGSRGKCAPNGHVAVYVEAGQERHVVPIAYLSHPPFQALLGRAKREFGYGQQGPGLRLPLLPPRASPHPT